MQVKDGLHEFPHLRRERRIRELGRLAQHGVQSLQPALEFAGFESVGHRGPRSR
jgi:hypothetical protein